MKPWERVVLLCALFAGVLTENCERQESRQGCRVEDGHAQCEAWNMTASIAGLPTCTTRITFSLLAQPQLVNKEKYTLLCLEDANFSRLPNLEELTIRTNRQNFSHLRLLVEDEACYQTLQKLRLRVLRSQMLTGHWATSKENAGLYTNFKFLDSLEITRAQKGGLSALMHVLGSRPSMTVLTLKNVQQFRSPSYTSNLDIAYFACGGNVRQLDLSYNDIMALYVSSDCWSSKLQYVNLDHNLLAKTIPVQAFWVHAFPMLAGLQVLRASSAGSKYHSGLWDEPDEVHLLDVSDNIEDSSRLSALSFLQQTPIGFLAGFDYWLKDLLKSCEHISYLKLVTCAAKNYNDNDAFFHCLDPNLNSYSCSSANVRRNLVCLLIHNCNYTCEVNIPLPLPPNLRSISMHGFGRFNNALSKAISCKKLIFSVHPNNKLQVFDMPSCNLHFLPTSIPKGFTLKGFHDVKYLNLQNHQLPFLLSRMNISSMRDLEVLHIGGERVSENDILPRYSLETFTKLSVLNLSYSNLKGFEPNTFLKHSHLAVLDLSYNQLKAPSLSFLDLSHTGLVSLNLSHNLLTSIPSSLRHQLESMEGLELYLSDNRFICDCDNLALLVWIQRDLPITLHYSGDHACADSPDNTIHSIEVDSLYCDWYWKQPLISVFSSLLIILVIAALAKIYNKRYHISNLVLRAQERFCLGSDNSPSTTYAYDAFVIYSSADDDRTWVHYVLQQVLEEDFGFRLCIHHRNFPAGYPIVDNIEKAIRTSRKVILVMSENCLKSDWCQTEVQMTASFDHSKFVVVMYKDVLFSGVHVPPIVRQLLETTTYIEWNEEPKEATKLFWKRLRKALHSRQQMAERTAGQPDRFLLLSDIPPDSVTQ